MSGRRKVVRTPQQEETQRLGVNASRRRQRWEKNAGAERMRGVESLVQDVQPSAEELSANPLYSRPPSYTLGGYTRSQIWNAMGWHDDISRGISPEHNVHDDQPHIPGLENREAAPLSAIDSAKKRGAERWEDLSPRDQEDTMRRIRAQSGATLASMQEAYGVQLDQAMMRATRNEAVPPHFYGAGEPNEVITRATDDLGVTRGLVSALQADNSPQTPFAVGQGSKRRYPQDEMARSAVGVAREHDVPAASNAELASMRPSGSMGYGSNYAKSVRRADQSVNQGVPAGETNPNAKGSGVGPKTGPYQRAWTGGTSSQFVSDVHSGGGGMVPHLGTSKPPILDAEGHPKVNAHGQTKRGSSQREDAISTAGFHLAADYAARQAHRERALHIPVKRGQETQWVEEQIQRPDLPQTEASVYGNAPHRDQRHDVDMAGISEVPEDVKWASKDWESKTRAPARGTQQGMF